MFKFGKKKDIDPVSPPALPTPAPAANIAPLSTAAENAPSASPESNAVAPAPKKEGFQHGLLTFKILETRGLKMPSDCNVTPGGPSGKDISCLPFAVIEMDKNEVIMRSVEANTIENSVIFQTRANL